MRLASIDFRFLASHRVIFCRQLVAVASRCPNMPRNINVDAPPDPHVILGIARNANEAEIRAAWKRTALLTHPDRSGDDGTQFRTAKAAYEALLPSAQPSFSYDHSVKRSASARRRRAQKPEAVKRAERARAAEEAAKERAAKEKKEAELRDRAERQRRAAERAMNDRRMQQETKRAFEERLFRQNQEAHFDDLKERAEQLAKERRDAIAANAGPSFANNSQARHADRLQARYVQYLQKKLAREEAEQAARPTGDGESSSQHSGTTSPSMSPDGTRRYGYGYRTGSVGGSPPRRDDPLWA